MQVDIYFLHREINVPDLESGQECGAAVEFKGIVRGSEEGEHIEALDYEAHESMAEKQLRSIIAELGADYVCDRVMFIHRLGEVKVGEVSLYLRVDSKHRAEAFGMCQKLIDQMKQDVPIWKAVPEV